jgi:hypothetical protein
LNFLNTFLKNPQISNFMEIRQLGAPLFHAGRHDEAKSRFSQFLERAQKRPGSTFLPFVRNSLRQRPVHLPDDVQSFS